MTGRAAIDKSCMLHAHPHLHRHLDYLGTSSSAARAVPDILRTTPPSTRESLISPETSRHDPFELCRHCNRWIAHPSTQLPVETRRRVALNATTVIRPPSSPPSGESSSR